MTRKSYPREFKLQALRMITEQGLSIAEAARRLGIGENLLRNGKKAAARLGADAFPGNGNLPPAEDERRKRRAEVTRLRAERDLLKKPRPTSPTRRADLRVHRGEPRRVAGELDVRSPGSVGVRRPRLGGPSALGSAETPRGVGGGDRGGPRGSPGAIRQSVDDRRVERPRVRLPGEHRRETHAPPRDSGQGPEAVRPHDRLAARLAGIRQPPRP
jgi:transposase